MLCYTPIIYILEGDIHKIKRILTPDFIPTKEMFFMAVTKNRTKIFKLLHEHSIKYNKHIDKYTKISSIASKNGNLELLKYLKNNGFDEYYPDLTLIAAIEFDNFDCIKYLSHNLDNIYRDKIINFCCLKGKLESLKYLIKIGYEINIDNILKASIKGNIDILYYLLKVTHIKECKDKVKITGVSSLSLSLNFVKFCISKFNWNSLLCENASIKGFLCCIKYICNTYPILIKDPYYFDTYKVIFNACKHDYIHIVKYIYKNFNNRKLWDRKTVYECIKNDSLNCLKFIHEKGYNLDNKMTELSPNVKNTSCLNYLYENGCKFSYKTMSNISYIGDLYSLKYYHNIGCGWDKETITNALIQGHIDCAEYAYKNGCEWDPYNLSKCIWAVSNKGISFCLNIKCDIDYEELINTLYREHTSEIFYKKVDPLLIEFIYSIDKIKYPKIRKILEDIEYYLFNNKDE